MITQLHAPRAMRQRGLTLVELLVALALGTLITLAAVAALTVSRQGFVTVDASSQLRDNARFATTMIRRLVVQAGYLDSKYASNTAASAFQLGDASAQLVEPSVKGFNNATFAEGLINGDTNTVSATGGGLNNSDLLVLRYQPGSITKSDGTEAPDQTMIDCRGSTAATAPGKASERIVSVFYIGSGDDGEPSLMCAWLNSAGTAWVKQPLVPGVESLQILYGVDGVTAGAAPTATPDSIPERYLRGDQLVTSSTTDTNANWERVRSVRIGMVLRGPPGSAPEKNVPAQYPLGAKDLMNASTDAGSTFAAQSDGRLRQTATFTIHLRNRQDLL